MRFFKKESNNIIYHKNLELLWECCQIPDFEKKLIKHINVIDKVFQFLSTRKKNTRHLERTAQGLEKTMETDCYL